MPDLSEITSSQGGISAHPTHRESLVREANELRFAHQPIVHTKGHVVGQELLCRSPRTNAEMGDPALFNTYATSVVLNCAFIERGLDRSMRDAKAPARFVNVDTACLMGPIVELITPRLGVIELLESIEINPRIVDRVAQLHRMGYRFAIDDVARLDDAAWGLLPFASYVKIDIQAVEMRDVPSMIDRARAAGATVVAEKVESQEIYCRLVSLGVAIFQGFVLQRPQELLLAPLPGCDAAVLDEVGRMVAKEVSAPAIANAARHDPALIMRLLSLQDIYACARRSHESDIVDAVASIPIRHLQGWLEVLRVTACHGHNSGWVIAARNRVAGPDGVALDISSPQWAKELTLCRNELLSRSRCE